MCFIALEDEKRYLQAVKKAVTILKSKEKKSKSEAITLLDKATTFDLESSF